MGDSTIGEVCKEEEMMKEKSVKECLKVYKEE